MVRALAELIPLVRGISQQFLFGQISFRIQLREIFSVRGANQRLTTLVFVPFSPKYIL
jgi:hypothetical protein